MAMRMSKRTGSCPVENSGVILSRVSNRSRPVPFHPLPPSQHRRPSRPVLFIERDMASIVLRGPAPARRSPAKVNDLRGRCEEDAAAARAERRAEIDILLVQEVPFVEQARGDGRVALHQQTRAADPIDLAGSRNQTPDVLAGPASVA